MMGGMRFLMGSERGVRPFYTTGRRTTGASLLREDATKAKLPAPLWRTRRRPSYQPSIKLLRDTRVHQTCHSAKRTHRFAIAFLLYHFYLQKLMPFAGEICRWVRFGKRTHRRGVFGSFSLKNGLVFGQRTHSRIVAWLGKATFSFPRTSWQSRRPVRTRRGRK